MNYSLESQAYYDNSLQKLTKNPKRKDSDAISNISFSDEEKTGKKKAQKSEIPTKSANKSLLESPFASLFEINPSNKSNKKNNSKEEVFLTQQFSANENKNSQIIETNLASTQSIKNMSNDNASHSFSLENNFSHFGGGEFYKKNFGKKEGLKTKQPTLASNNYYGESVSKTFEKLFGDDEKTSVISEKEKNTNFPQKSEVKAISEDKFIYENKFQTPIKNSKETGKRNSIETLNHFLPQNQKELFKTPEIISKSINKSTSKLSENAENIIKIPTQKHFITPNAESTHKNTDASNDAFSKSKSASINETTKQSIQSIENPSAPLVLNDNAKPNLSEKNKFDETIHQKTPGGFIKPTPKTPTIQSANKQIANKSYGDIFKQRIDQKKVGELAIQAKQNTLISISREAVPNKKYVAKYMENFIKKNKLDPKEKEPQDSELQQFHKLFFEGDKKDARSGPKKRKRDQNKNKTFFAQEAENNSEESVSDCDEEISIEGDIRKLSKLDIDFDGFFEEAMEHPLIGKKNFKKKGKIAKKLDIKSKRIRIKKDKTVKEYLQDTYFTYTSKPLRWTKLPPVKDKAKPHEYRLPECESFIGKTGIKVPTLFSTIKPYDFFLQFMPETIYQETARLTNISASLEFYNFNTNKRREYKDVTTHDIKKWFGLIFLFGIVRKYSVDTYWSTDPLLGLNCVNKIMNKNRFTEIRRFLAFYDKRKKAEYEKVYPPLDPFYKFRFLLDHINEVCRKNYVPERELSVDESMISYQGVHRLKVFMPRKPIKWGFKAFVLSESSSGYVCNMILNEGHKRGENEDILSKRVVLQILQGYEHQGYRVYMDRWYTSADLLSELKKRGFGGCGTIFLSRVGLVNDLRKDVREFKDPGEATFFTNNEMCFVAWYQYRRQVYVLSNFHSPDWTKVEKIRKIAYFCKKEYKIYDYDAPKMIRDYNIFMGGVDLFNQRVSYYTVDYDIMKWYMRLVFWIFEIAMVNSYLLYCKVMKEKKLKAIAASDFRLEIIRNLTHWDFDPTKPTFRKGITNQMLDKDKDLDAVDKDFHNLNIKRKSEFNLDEMNVFTEVKLKSKCSIEYVGVGMCDVCQTKRRKLKKTEYWCKACHKGVCVPCFDQHRLQNIFNNLAKDKDVTDLLCHIIRKKKIKVEETSKFFEAQIQKSKPKPKNPKQNDENKSSTLNLEGAISEINGSDIFNKPWKILNKNDESLQIIDSSSEDSEIYETKKKIDHRVKLNFDGYLKKSKEKAKAEDSKNHQHEFKQLKADLENFYTLNDNINNEIRSTNEFLPSERKSLQRCFFNLYNIYIFFKGRIKLKTHKIFLKNYMNRKKKMLLLIKF